MSEPTEDDSIRAEIEGLIEKRDSMLEMGKRWAAFDVQMEIDSLTRMLNSSERA